MLEVCDNTIFKVITFSGNLGFLTLKPTKSLKSSFNDALPASMSCMIAVAEKDFEMEAILKMS
ncbi:hypothetical protein D3C72_2366520 [compost metagenome]